jgi:hypothetical protein
MKKRLLATALATAIVLAVAPLALAAAHHGNSSTKAAKAAKHKPFLCKGSVVSVDTTAGTLVVTVAKGSRSMRPFVGAQVTFTLSPHARILARTIDGSGNVAYRPVSLDQVTPGSRAHINGRLYRSGPGTTVFNARLVKVILAPAVSPAPSDPPSPAPSPAPSDSPSPAPCGSATP